MQGNSWWPIALTWIIAIIVAGSLWARFTRPPAPTENRAPILGTTTRPRRVVPVWLVLVLLIILAIALWVTVRFLARG